jgi:RNA-directed DNA polymerase
MCNLTFREDDVIEKDHIIAKALGGSNDIDNTQLLHGHCHDEKSKDDLKAIKKHKAIKSYQKYIKRFDKSDWIWIDDIPTVTFSVGSFPQKS